MTPRTDLGLPDPMLSSLGGTAGAKAIGLELGAGDYVTNPFSWPELAARIRVMLCRHKLISWKSRTDAPNDAAGHPGIGGGVGNLPSSGPVSGTGVLTVKNSGLSGNSASGFGGGLRNADQATATMIGSTVSFNSAATGGGLASQGRLVMKGSLVTRNTASAAGGIAKLGRHGAAARHHSDPQRAGQLRAAGWYPRLHRLGTRQVPHRGRYCGLWAGRDLPPQDRPAHL